ncbi:hypothetical protein ACYOEI_25800 [Singulisphaera rosea]
MFAQIRTAALLGVLGLGTVGCAGVREVRYVYQDGESGVVGLPENTSRWPTYYRKHAEELMAKHFPEGYEIVRAEEVDEGSRTLTIKGTNAAEIDAAGPANMLSLAKLGRTSSRTQSDTLKIRECRIVYKKSRPTDHGDYAEQANWTPPVYVDPNIQARKPGTPPKSEAAKRTEAPRQAKSSPDEAKLEEPKLEEPELIPNLGEISEDKPLSSEKPAPPAPPSKFKVA